jgi:excisionase family DNA binding protein
MGANKTGKLTTHQAGQRLGLSGDTVRRMCEQGDLDAHRTGGLHWRIEAASVERFIEDSRPKVRRR